MDMNGEQTQAGLPNLERQARAAFDASVDSLDGATRSRLNQSRQRALAAAASTASGPARRPGPGRAWHTWAPAGALAAGVLATALLLRAPGNDPAQDAAVLATAAAPVAEEAAGEAPLEVLAAGDDEFEIATSDEELEFYAWIELAAADVASGQTG
jgi:anti-sigma factor RsiW